VVDLGVVHDIEGEVYGTIKVAENRSGGGFAATIFVSLDNGIREAASECLGTVGTTKVWFTPSPAE
jgi:hypothetical protein